MCTGFLRPRDGEMHVFHLAEINLSAVKQSPHRPANTLPPSSWDLWAGDTMSLLIVHSKDLNKWLGDLWVMRKHDFFVCLFVLDSLRKYWLLCVPGSTQTCHENCRQVQFPVIFAGILRSSQLPWFLLRWSLRIFEETQERRSSSSSDYVLRGGRDS